MAEAMMNDTYKNLYQSINPLVQPQLSQRYWETYCLNHCQYEAMTQTIDPSEFIRLEQQCHSRLAIERTAQLNHLAAMGW
ncbi:MAG: hypothetical protein AAFY17_09455 [Cyanobacteria bacterium J06642_11]